MNAIVPEFSNDNTVLSFEKCLESVSGVKMGENGFEFRGPSVCSTKRRERIERTPPFDPKNLYHKGPITTTGILNPQQKAEDLLENISKKLSEGNSFRKATEPTHRDRGHHFDPHLVDRFEEKRVRNLRDTRRAEDEGTVMSF